MTFKENCGMVAFIASLVSMLGALFVKALWMLGVLPVALTIFGTHVIFAVLGTVIYFSLPMMCLAIVLND